MKKPVFEGVATALVTPFKQGTVDFAVMNQLLDLQLAAGVDAVVVCGTTGEASTMTDNEKLALIAHTVKYCAGRCKIIAGTGTNDTAHTLQLSRVAASMGVDAVLLVTPYYNKCTQAGLIAHYTAAADTVPCPVIVYNVPSRTGVDVSVETCRALCAHPNIGGIKEASGSVPKAMRILDACAEELPLWSGNDDLTVPLMAVGARGAISVLSNVRPKLTLQMVRACQAGEYAQAGRIQTALMGLVDALFCEVNPIPVKQALALEGEDPYSVFLSGSKSLLTITNPSADTDRELVIFRDSFASSLAPLLTSAYAKITLVDIRYVQPERLGRWLTFDSQDVLFLYSVSVLNHSETLK